jgi:hypothetical protein
MPHQKHAEPGFISSAALSIIGVAMLVGLTVAEKIGRIRTPKK